MPGQSGEGVHHDVLGLARIVDEVSRQPDQVGVVDLEDDHHASGAVRRQIHGRGVSPTRWTGTTTRGVVPLPRGPFTTTQTSQTDLR